MPTFGALSSFTFTSFRSAGDTTWDQSEAVDLGSSGADALAIYTQFLAGSTAASTAGHYVDFYLSTGPSTTFMSGGWGGGDNSYDPVSDAALQLPARSLTYLGRTPYGDSLSSAIEYNETFIVPGPIPEFVAVVTYNDGVALSASTNVQVNYQTVDNS